MKNKKEILLITLAIVVLTGYLVTRKTDRTEYKLPDFPAISPSDISALEISRKDSTIRIEKTDTGWVIQPNQFPADKGKLDEMLNALDRFSLTALVSESGNLTRYELDDDHKIRIRAWAGNDLKRDLEMGKAASTYQHTFVRLPDTPQVYHALGNLRTQFDQTVKNLRNKIVMSFQPEDITEISIIMGGKPTKLVKSEPASESDPKTDASWKTDRGQPADMAAVNRILGALSHLRCESYPEKPTPGDPGKIHSEFHLKGKTDLSLTIFEKSSPNDKGHPAVSSDTPYSFVLADHTVESLKADPTLLLKP
jgi:hypothetical protein